MPPCFCSPFPIKGSNPEEEGIEFEVPDSIVGAENPGYQESHPQKNRPPFGNFQIQEALLMKGAHISHFTKSLWSVVNFHQPLLGKSAKKNA